MPLPSARWAPLAQLHGHAQLVGFAGLLVMGIGYRVFPRFRGAPAPAATAVVASFALVATGLALRSALAWPAGEIRTAALAAGGILELAGALVYARLVLGTLVAGDSEHRPDEILIALGALWFPLGLMWAFVALAPALAGAPAGDPVADGASVTALLLGFVASTVLGVSLRVAPAFVAAPPAPPRPVIAGAALWYAGLTVLPLWPQVAPLAILGGGLLLTWTVGVFRTSAAVQLLGAAARLTRLALRAGYLWLLFGLTLLALAAVASWPIGGATTAARHALALGFLMSVVFAVGARLIPALTGGRALPLAAVGAALALTNAAAVLRVGYELAGSTAPGAPAALAFSGLFAYAALLVFAVSAARSVRSAVSAFA